MPKGKKKSSNITALFKEYGSVLNTAQVADLVSKLPAQERRMTLKTIQRWIREKYLPASKNISAVWEIKKADLANWLFQYDLILERPKLEDAGKNEDTKGVVCDDEFDW